MLLNEQAAPLHGYLTPLITPIAVIGMLKVISPDQALIEDCSRFHQHFIRAFFLYKILAPKKLQG